MKATKNKAVLPLRLRQRIAKLGFDISVARRKRSLTIGMMAERIGVHKNTYLKVEKGLAPLSVSAYRSDLEQYSEFLLKRKRGLKDARRQDVRDFLNALFGNGIDGRSVARKLSALRHLYKYLLLDRYISADPTLNIDSPRQWKVLPKSLATDEVESVLLGPPHAKDDRHSRALAARDRAMLEVFYAGALRVSEVVNLKLEDLKQVAAYFEQGWGVAVSDRAPASDYMDALREVPGLREAIDQIGVFETPGLMATASEFVFEGLHLHQKLNKERSGGRYSYHA